MAPLPPGLKKPSARSFRLQRIAGQVHHAAPDKTFRPGAAVNDDFIDSKRDKRIMKHSSFVSRIASAGISKPKKRSSAGGRRPGNKLGASLGDLADALPELEAGEGGAEILDGKIKHKSLRSKKGALKRKERVVRGEMERFGVSMAKLAGAPVSKEVEMGSGIDNASAAAPADASTNQPSAPTANRWAALRGYISSTMEQNPAFAGKN